MHYVIGDPSADVCVVRCAMTFCVNCVRMLPYCFHSLRHILISERMLRLGVTNNRSTVLYLFIYFIRELAPREKRVIILAFELSRTSAAEAPWASFQACWRLIASNERPTQVNCQINLSCGVCYMHTAP